MKTKPAKSATRLPAAEWNFDKLLLPKETSLAFYYEYGRDSETVKVEVATMRAKRKRHVWHYSPRDHWLEKVLFWLAQRDSFPSIPWLALPQVWNEEEKELVRAIQTPTDLRPDMSFNYVWGGDEQAQREFLAARAQTFVPPATDAIVLNPEASYFEFGVNWHRTDAEIVEMVANIIKESRPEQFKKYAILPLIQCGFNGEKLPFRKGAALQWLGVLRRRNAVATWPEYFACYPKKTYSNRSGSFERGDERGPEADCRKARLILAWFDSGTPLKKKDFV